MDNRLFDKLIKEKLQDHESAVPAAMWERIAAGRQQRRNGWLLKIYMLASIFAMLGIATVWFAPKAPLIHRAMFSTPDTKTLMNAIVPQPNKQNNSVIIDIKAKHKKTSYTYLPSTLHKSSKTYKKQKIKAKQSGNGKDLNQQVNNIGMASKTADRDANNTNTPSSSLYAGTTSTSPPQLSVKPQSAQDSTNSTTDEMIRKTDRFSLEVFVSPSIAISQISAGDRTYEQILKNSMQTQVSYTAGFRFKYAFSEKIHFKIGVQYAVVNASGSYKDSLLNTQQSNNKYRFIGVPLLAGYRAGLPNHIQWGIDVGVIVNVHSHYQGIVPLNTGGFANIGSEPVYSVNAHAVLHLSTNFSKSINRHMELFLEPWLQYRSKSITARFYSFEQRLHTAGLGMGVRYKLYKEDE